MFEPGATPRVFAVPPGADFPQALVRGLRARCGGHRPEALARVQLVLNTRRMARRVRELFDQGPPCMLPRISLVTDLGESANGVLRSILQCGCVVTRHHDKALSTY